jgi:uncharacterized protein YajQ (UPF0234 family)
VLIPATAWRALRRQAMRDDLQAAIAALREHDFEVPLQFNNFRD